MAEERMSWSLSPPPPVTRSGDPPRCTRVHLGHLGPAGRLEPPGNVGDVSISLSSDFARAVPEMAVSWEAVPVPEPVLLVLNEPLAKELGLDPAWLRSDGLPFLVEELLASAVGAGFIHYESDGWRAGDVDGFAVPERFVDIVRQRLAALPSASATALAVAAIAAPQFTAELLAVLTDCPVAEVLATIQHGESAQLVGVAREPRLGRRVSTRGGGAPRRSIRCPLGREGAAAAAL